MNKEIVTPQISVIMGVFNCARTLIDAIKCIQSQTYSNWEFIICDDGSTDDTFLIAQNIAESDSRIILLQNESNMGLNYTLNRCLKYAQGEYIARMDGDDLCEYDRFEKQVMFLDNNLRYAIVSSPMKYFDENGIWGEGKAIEYPDKYAYLFGSPFAHAPCMVRKEAFLAVDGYSEQRKYNRCEDYHLWYKMMRKGYKGYNIQEVLYSMRDDKNAFKRRKLVHRLKGMSVQFEVFRGLGVPFIYYPLIFKGPIAALVPQYIYTMFHKFFARK